MSVRLILDTTAVLAYLRLDGIDVGELIGTVQENGDMTGIPALAILSAYDQLKPDEQTRLADLVAETDGPTVVIPLLSDDVLAVAEVAGRVKGDHGLAHAAVEARKHEAVLATFAGADARLLLDDDDVLDL